MNIQKNDSTLLKNVKKIYHYVFICSQLQYFSEPNKNKDGGPIASFDGHFHYDDQKRHCDHLKHNINEYILI